MASATPESAPGRSRARIEDWLFNPFAYIAGGRALAIGLAAILVAGLVGSLSNAHFDGVLDVHFGRPAPASTFAAEGIIDWIALAVVLLLLGKALSRTDFRLIDLLGTQAMARWPMLIVAAVSLMPPSQRYAMWLSAQLQKTEGAVQPGPLDVYVFAVAMTATVLAIVWTVSLMYRAYAVCCNMRGIRSGVSFIFGLILAEVASKIAIVGIFSR